MPAHILSISKPANVPNMTLRFPALRRLALTFAAAATLSLQAQTAVEQFFLSLPDSEMEVLPEQTRRELLQLSSAGSDPIVSNLFAMPSRLTRHTDAHLAVSLTPASRYEVHVLPTDSAPLFGTIRTLLSPAPASQLAFYTASHRQVPGVFTMPDLGEFLNVPDSVAYIARKQWAAALVPLHIEAHWEPGNDAPVLILEVHTQGLSIEQRQAARQVFRPVKMRWNRGKWVRE